MRLSRAIRAVVALLAVTLPFDTLGTEMTDAELAEIRHELRELKRRDAEQRALIERLERRLGEREAERAAAAQPTPEASPPPAPVATESAEKPRGDLWSTQIGGASLRLMDIGLDALVAAGGSSVRNGELELLQGGEHDPRQRGFNLQQVELSFQGSIDPFLQGDAFLIFFLDAEGETRLELEEAFVTTLALPFGLHDLGFQVEAGTFFTEFGRQNPQHPHFWRFQDQPVVLSRFFGGDGLRGPGVRVGWLTPLPWFSEFHVGMQNAIGETQVSFLANDEVFEERAIGGRPFADPEIRSTADFTYLLRWVNGFDLTDSISSQVGVSALFGPNATGERADTRIVGGDVVAKWRPARTDRGWPFVVVQGEALFRRYEVEGFMGATPMGAPLVLPSDVLKDWGFYAEALYGFVRGWVAGLRFEHADSITGTSYRGAFPIWNSLDPFRAKRRRISPLLIFHPSEFARIRLQYNYDRTSFLRSGHAHTVWVGIEFGLGAHPAHAY